MTTRILSAAQLGATGALVSWAMNHHPDWRMAAVIGLWGILSSAWGFSAGLDSANSRSR